MSKLFIFYTGLSFGLKILLCLALIVVFFSLSYGITYLIGKHNMKKRKRLEAVKKAVGK